MKKSRFTDSQIMDALKRAEAGIKVQDLCRELDMCNDPAESAHFKPLMQMPQRVFSCPAPDAGAVGCKSQSSHQ